MVNRCCSINQLSPYHCVDKRSCVTTACHLDKSETLVKSLLSSPSFVGQNLLLLATFFYNIFTLLLLYFILLYFTLLYFTLLWTPTRNLQLSTVVVQFASSLCQTCRSVSFCLMAKKNQLFKRMNCPFYWGPLSRWATL